MEVRNRLAVKLSKLPKVMSLVTGLGFEPRHPGFRVPE